MNNHSIKISRSDAAICIEALEIANQYSLRSIWNPLAAELKLAISTSIAQEERAKHEKIPPQGAFGGTD